MNLFELHRLMKDPDLVNQRIADYMDKGILKRQDKDVSEIKGHLEKCEHNLNFVLDNIKLGYFDWCITGCYYSLYHAAVALLILKEYRSKNHDATLCVLLKEYYNQGIGDKDLELFNGFFLDYQDMLFYVESKNRREEATYSSNRVFDKSTVQDLRVKSILFVDKAKEIIDNYKIG